MTVKRKTVEIAPLIESINGIKDILSVYDDAIAANMAMNDYIAKLNELLNYSENGTLELLVDTLELIAEHECDALEIKISKEIGKFQWCSNALQDIYGSFVDMADNLPTLDSLPAYNEMLDEQDRNQREHHAHEASRRL